jgi:hypothetical protein
MYVEKDKVTDIRRYHKYGWNIDTIANKVGLRGLTVRHVLANKDYEGVTVHTADELAATAKHVADLEAKLAALNPKSAPARVVKEVEAAEQAAAPKGPDGRPLLHLDPYGRPLPPDAVHVVNLDDPNRVTAFRFRTTNIGLSAGIPDRTEPTRAPDRSWDIFSGKPF